MMAAPKGHPNYNTSKDPMLNGGYFGRHEDTYSDELLKELGMGVVNWIQERGNIYLKYFFSVKGIGWQTVHKLCARSPMFKEYLDRAKEIQESKLVSEPYNRKADGNHARFILARHHKGEYEDKPMIIKEEEIDVLNKSMSLVDHLQSATSSDKNDLNNDESNINTAQ